MANEFVIKNGYFSQGNSNVTGSLQVSGSVGVTGSASITGSLTSIGTSTFSGSVLMTGSLNAIVSGAIDLTGFITASKIFITSSGNEQLMVIGSGSSSWITGIYGSQGNLLTVTDTFSGSIFTVTDISGYPILDVTSDYYTSSINTIGFLNHTGSAEITGSLIVSGGLQVYLTNAFPLPSFPVINSDQTRLRDTIGNTSIEWSGRNLYDTSEFSSIDWTARYLYADDGTTIHIEWWDPAAMILPNIATNPIDNILGIDATGRVYYTASSAIGGGGSGTPGGANRQVQYNNGGVFGGSPNFTFDGSNAVFITGSLIVSGSGTFTNIGPAIFSGSIDTSGSITANTFTGSFTGSLLGTSSWANNALTASYFSNFNSTTIGDGINTTYTITHNFNTKNLHITVYETSSNGETVYPDIRRNGLNTAQIVFANPPSSGSYIVYISQ